MKIDYALMAVRLQMSIRQVGVLIAGTALVLSSAVFRPPTRCPRRLEPREGAATFWEGNLGYDLANVEWGSLAAWVAILALLLTALIVAVGWVERWAGLR